VTIRLTIGLYYLVVVAHCNRASIFNCFRDICIQIYQGHELTFRVTWRHRSPDQSICHMHAISYWYPNGAESSSSIVFEIFGPETVRTHTRCKWFYTLSHVMYCNGQIIRPGLQHLAKFLQIWRSPKMNANSVYFELTNLLRVRECLGLYSLSIAAGWWST